MSAKTLATITAQPGACAVDYFDPAHPDRVVTLNTYRPAQWTPDSPVVLVQHGVLRNGDDYRDFWIPAADRHGLLIIAPTFSDAAWPELDSYNNGLVRDETGAVRPVDEWGYAVLGRLWDALRAQGVTRQAQAYLFGHSAGGQFVHRLMSSQPHAPYKGVIAGNSGWYTLPDLAPAWPEGLAIDGLTRTHLENLLAYPLCLLLGEADSDVNAPNLPMNPEALRQGPHRFARGHNYYEQGRKMASQLGVPFNWRAQDVPGIGHDGRAMSAVAASLWFEGRMPDAAALAALAGDQVA